MIKNLAWTSGLNVTKLWCTLQLRRQRNSFCFSSTLVSSVVVTVTAFPLRGLTAKKIRCRAVALRGASIRAVVLSYQLLCRTLRRLVSRIVYKNATGRGWYILKQKTTVVNKRTMKNWFRCILRIVKAEEQLENRKLFLFKICPKKGVYTTLFRHMIS